MRGLRGRPAGAGLTTAPEQPGTDVPKDYARYFDQLTGDFAGFLGIPSLEQIVTPVAMRAWDKTMSLIVRGLLGPDIRLTGSRRDTDAVLP
ncbi:hypothetical protein [Streptomyces sp. NPDC050528]|uniref:hypothetical protein n=1 Tax=unclassified Streptomyces TaxID=2593676 RepID=UPI003793AADF